MPRSLEPGIKYPIVLAGDEGKSPCPTFFAKSLSVRDQRNIADSIGRIAEASGKGDVFIEAARILGNAIVGWEGMVDPNTGEEIAFDPDRLVDLLAIDELMDLVGKVTSAGMLAMGDRKKSESPPC